MRMRKEALKHNRLVISKCLYTKFQMDISILLFGNLLFGPTLSLNFCLLDIISIRCYFSVIKVLHINTFSVEM